MTSAQALKAYTAAMNTFWGKTILRWETAANNPNAYTANNYAADVVGFWVDAADAWWGQVSSPVLPTVNLTVATGSRGQTSGDAYVTSSVPTGPGASINTSDLEAPGGARVVASQLSGTISGGELTITADFAPTAPPAPGAYFGVAWVVDKPIAYIVLVVT